MGPWWSGNHSRLGCNGPLLKNDTHRNVCRRTHSILFLNQQRTWPLALKRGGFILILAGLLLVPALLAEADKPAAKPEEGKPVTTQAPMVPAGTVPVKPDSHPQSGIPPVPDVENLSVNWKGDDTNPLISPDGSFLIFQSDRPGSAEGQNFWFSYNRNHLDRMGQALWTVPVSLRFPLEGDASDTMKILRPQGRLGEQAGLFSVNTDGFDGLGSILWRNEKPVEMYFTSNMKAQGSGFDGLNIYYTRFRDDRWSKPVHLNSINSNFDDRMPWISRDGEYMIFSSNRPGGYGGDDLYYSKRDPATGKWSEVKNLGPDINTSYNEIAPSLSPDRGTLFFSSDRPGGLGHYDIYFSRFNEASPGRAENLGKPFNSSRDDEHVSISEDRLWVYFASERAVQTSRGGMDLYRLLMPEWLRDPLPVKFTALIMDSSTRLPLGVEATVAIQWEGGRIVKLSRGFNKDPQTSQAMNFENDLITGREYRLVISAPGFHPQELLLDYRGNVPPGRRDHRLIYLEPIKELPNETIDKDARSIPGEVLDADNDLPVNGARLRKLAGDRIQIVQTQDKGRFTIKVLPGEKFSMRADAAGYATLSENFQETKDLKKIILRLKTQKGPPCTGDEPACIDNLRIFFPTGRSDVNANEQKKLDAIVRIMKKEPTLKLEVRGHTDKTFNGPDKVSFEFNQKLSEERARNVRALLVRAGVPEARLTLKGASYLEPEEPEVNAKARDRNRRVEFRRLSLEK